MWFLAKNPLCTECLMDLQWINYILCDNTDMHAVDVSK